MNESRKIEEVFHSGTLDSEYASIDAFMQNFNSYLHDMNMKGAKKQLVRHPGDSLPCLVSINGFS